MDLPSVLGPLKPIHGTLGGLPGAVAQGKELTALSIPGQLNEYWCWAAVTEGIWKFFQAARAQPQCQIAERVLRKASGECCDAKTNGACNLPFYLDRALAAANCFRVLVDLDVTFSAIVQEINDERPIGVRIDWGNGTGHFVVVSGWSVTAAGVEVLTVQDPWGPSTSIIPRSVLRSSYGAGEGSWTHSFYTQPPSTIGGGVPTDGHYRRELLGGH
jgi:hypothetical protein